MIAELENGKQLSYFDKERQMLYEPKYTLAGASYK